MSNKTKKPEEVIDLLKTRGRLSLRKPSRPWNKSLTNTIAELGVHPAVESGLHILNDDLESAHFLVRHCQGQAIADHWHGILHRIENDFRNSRLWYQNRITDESRSPYFATLEDAHAYIWACQNVVVAKNSQNHDVTELEERGMAEIRGLLDKAIQAYGLQHRLDASEYLSSTEDDRETKLKMTTNQIRREGHENE